MQRDTRTRTGGMLHCEQNHGNAFANMNGGPATSEAMTLAGSLYSAAARTLHIRIKPLANDLATAATTITFFIEFLHLGTTPDQ